MKRQQPEFRECCMFMRWAEYNPKIGQDLMHIPNGGSRHPLEAANLKRIGVRRGVSDYFFMQASGKWHGLWIEFKAGKNKLSPHQAQFFERAESNDYKCIVVWSWEDAVLGIKDYLGQKATI